MSVETRVFFPLIPGNYIAVDPFENSGEAFAIKSGITALGAIDERHQQSFRYFESGYPFEYYMVRFFYYEKRDIESGKKLPSE